MALPDGDSTGERRNAVVDWPSFLGQELPPPKWMAGQLMERGQQMAIVGAGEAGKSLLMFDFAAAIAAGRKFLGDVEREPLRVLYLDQENSALDLRRRVSALGLTPDDLARVSYMPFPVIEPLDTGKGAEQLHDEVRHHEADVVFLDTMSRFIKGPENESQTWLDLYRLSLKPLKRRGVAVVRLDHFGKDTERGSRGSSAKNQDIDHTWELTVVDKTTGRLRLRRTRSRTGLGPSDFHLIRHGRPGEAGTTWHEAVPEHETVGTKWKGAQEVARRLDEAGAPPNIGRIQAREWCKKLEITVNNEILAEVVKARKLAAKTCPQDQDRLPGQDQLDLSP